MVETPLITKAFLLTAVSKKAAHFSLFVKIYFENSYKKLGPAFLRDPDFLNLVTLAIALPVSCFFDAAGGIDFAAYQRFLTPLGLILHRNYATLN